MMDAYTLKLDLIFDEELIKDFLIAVTDGVNGMEKPVVKHKLKIKTHKKYFTIKLKVKFIDGTKMVFKNKYDLDISGEFIKLSPQDIAKAYGQTQATAPATENENKIGFQLD